MCCLRLRRPSTRLSKVGLTSYGVLKRKANQQQQTKSIVRETRATVFISAEESSER